METSKKQSLSLCALIAACAIGMTGCHNGKAYDPCKAKTNEPWLYGPNTQPPNDYPLILPKIEEKKY